MGVRYAEVIGDPVSHSKSPLIHKFWLEKLGLDGDFRIRRVEPRDLPRYLSSHCADPFWRGCSVTAPLKEKAAQLVSDPTGICRRIGACNAVFRSPFGCGIGANTDVVGVAAAIGRTPRADERACIIGAGGAARAVAQYFRANAVGELVSLVRNPAAAGDMGLEAFGFESAAQALAGAHYVVNATPLGMTGMSPLPAAVTEALPETAPGAIVCDLVYAPLETPLLARARELGREAVDGLAALIGQAAPAFELFFGAEAPREHDAELRERLAS